MCLSVSLCVCVRERERERKRQRQRHRVRLCVQVTEKRQCEVLAHTALYLRLCLDTTIYYFAWMLTFIEQSQNCQRLGIHFIFK